MAKLVALASLIVLVGSLGVIAASCGSAGGSPPGSAPQQPSTISDTDSTKTLESSPPKLAGDGRYFGFIEAAKDGPPMISFDVAQHLTGEAANRAAAEDGVVSPGEPVPNDYYVRNADTRTEQLNLAKDVQITAASPVTRLTLPAETRARCRSGCAESIPVSLPDFFASFTNKADASSAKGGPFWITIRDGVVVRIDEQYFP